MELKQKRCAIYTRKSIDEGLEQEFNTLDAQRNLCESYVKSQKHNGWVIIPKHYDDGGFSGGNMKRPGLQMLFADIKAGLVEVVVVYKIDRLSRSLLDFSKINDFFDTEAIGFVSVTQDINTNTSAGRMLWNMLMTFAQFERETISERVRDKIAASKRMGKHCTGITPIGYKKNPEKRCLEIDSREAKIVRWIFKRYLKVKSCGLVARELNERGITTRQWTSKQKILHGGNKWGISSVRKVIANPIYVGFIPHHKQMYPGEHEALVSAETWDKAQELRNKNNMGREKRLHHRSSAVLGSLLHCGECNCAMTTTYTVKHRKRYYYYYCVKAMKYPDHSCPTSKLPINEIENIVLSQIEMIFRCYSVRSAVKTETESLRKQYANALIKERSGFRAYHKNCKDKISCDAAKDKIRKLDCKLKVLNQEIKPRSIEKRMDHFSPLWNDLSPLEKVELLDTLIEKIEVFSDRISCRLQSEFVDLELELSSHLRNANSCASVRRDGDSLVFTTPINTLRVSGKIKLEVAGEGYESNRICFLHAIALSWKWSGMLFAGEVASIAALAKKVGYSQGYVGRILSLFNLAPSILEDIISDKIPEGLSLNRLYDGIPDDWNEQRKKFGFAVAN